MNIENENQPKPSGLPSEKGTASRFGRWRFWAILAILIGIVAIAVKQGIGVRIANNKKLVEETAEMAVWNVSTIQPNRKNAEEELVLPANIRALSEASILARTSGYLKKYYVDIGSRVARGQLLAELDTPEIDQQFRQAQADLVLSKANLKLAEITASRYRELLQKNFVSKQDADTAFSNAEARKAAVESAEYNVQHLNELQIFKKILAPYAGVITARNAATGMLVDAGGGNGAKELFHIADTSKLRLFVNVPEIYSRSIKPGISADFVLAEHPGRRFQGKLVRTANAIDASTRTFLTEFQMDNPKGEILAGAHAKAYLKLPNQATTFFLPANTLIFRADGLQVATVRNNGNIAIVKITLGRDYGKEVEVIDGLHGDETVVLNPPDSLLDGATVRVVNTNSATKPQ